MVVRLHNPSSWPTSRQLAPTEVHVWRASLDQPPIPSDKLVQWLSPDERERACRLRGEESRNRFITARGLLRALIGRYLSVKPAGVQITYGPNGKPTVSSTGGVSPLQFNLSHSEGLALYAFASRWR